MFLSPREPNTSVYSSTQVLQGFESCCKLLLSRTFLQNWKFVVNIAFFFFLFCHKRDLGSVICSLLYQFSICLREVESFGVRVCQYWFLFLLVYALIVFTFYGRGYGGDSDVLCVTIIVKIQTCFIGTFYYK